MEEINFDIQRFDAITNTLSAVTSPGLSTMILLKMEMSIRAQ